ncbi:hypothetical protein VNO77_25635 [Canavalia gladiata]|uniref:Uncharacterized protein n=1 Tax=Canavalia gladiata TaxID=3824 RepID=A0AAN9L925_CANGL
MFVRLVIVADQCSDVTIIQEKTTKKQGTLVTSRKLPRHSMEGLEVQEEIQKILPIHSHNAMPPYASKTSWGVPNHEDMLNSIPDEFMEQTNGVRITNQQSDEYYVALVGYMISYDVRPLHQLSTSKQLIQGSITMGLGGNFTPVFAPAEVSCSPTKLRSCSHNMLMLLAVIIKISTRVID